MRSFLPLLLVVGLLGCGTAKEASDTASQTMESATETVAETAEMAEEAKAEPEMKAAATHAATGNWDFIIVADGGDGDGKMEFNSDGGWVETPDGKHDMNDLVVNDNDLTFNIVHPQMGQIDFVLVVDGDIMAGTALIVGPGMEATVQAERK